MPLTSGTRLGVYEIVAVLGAGGMGEVYRARDTRLGREVAIKVILEAFAGDADRVARFQREAKLLASLNHPQIAALYGLEEAAGEYFLVMELVEGQTLADRLARGPLPVDEALAIAVQIADALEAAHARGVVHRDLKPANVKVTPDDRVKVLDFGLAKAVETEATSANAANSPTLSMMASQAGIILGTAAYTSPEQAKGLPADHRSDIFSFGSVLFEMLTGRQPFPGDTAPEVLASVLVREADIGRLPANLNPRLVELIRRCLEKSPRRRWQAVGDVRAELETIAAAPRVEALTSSVPQPRPLWRRAAPLAAIAIASGALAGAAAWMLKPVPRSPIVRFSITIPTERIAAVGRRTVAISPDGTVIAYAARQQIYVRRIGDLQATPLQGAQEEGGVISPTFSPDGRSLVYYSPGEGTLKRVALSGGPPVTLCSGSNPAGISWGDDGIVFAEVSPEKVVRRVPAAGGSAQAIVNLNPDQLPDGPQMLPDKETLLLTVGTNKRMGAERWDKAQVIAYSLKSGARKVLIDGGSDARYLATGHLAYAIGGTLYAVPFDLRTLTVTGAAFPILEGVRRAGGGATGMADFSVSPGGALAYVSGPVDASGPVALAMADLEGRLTPLSLTPGAYAAPRAAPDGTHIAVQASDSKSSFIGVFDRKGSGTLGRITYDANSNSPVWSPDGTRVAFQSTRDGDAAIFVAAADGSGAPDRLTRPRAGETDIPHSWYGDVLLFDLVTPAGVTLWQISVKTRIAAPFGGVRSAGETDAVLAPDGRLVAYSTTEEGAVSLFVQPFPANGARFMLVKARGSSPHHPIWSPDGKTLIYLPAPGAFERVAVDIRPTFSFGSPKPVPRAFQGAPPAARRQYDIMPDGGFLGLVTPAQAAGTATVPEVCVVLNWFDEVKSRAGR